LIIPYQVTLWWNFVDYDGDMPYGVVVVLQRISFAITGLLPVGLALTIAMLRGHLRAIPPPTILCYAVGAGLLWEGVPLVVSPISRYIPFAGGLVHFVVVTGTYYGLLAGLSRLRAVAAYSKA
jgi:hypothetical protein